MKQIIIVIGLGVVIVLSCIIVLSIDGKTERKNELQRAVSGAVKQTVEYSQIDDQKEINSNDEMIAYFIQILSLGVKADGELQIQVMGVDCKEGMLDVLVTEKFRYLNGKEGNISVRKCAIAE